MLDAGHAKSMLCDDLEGGVGKVMGVYRMEGTHMPVDNNTYVGPKPS